MPISQSAHFKQQIQECISNIYSLYSKMVKNRLYQFSVGSYPFQKWDVFLIEIPIWRELFVRYVYFEISSAAN